MRIVLRMAYAVRLVFAVVFAVVVSTQFAIAQQMRADPSDPSTPVPMIAAASAFADYQPFREQKVAPWKQVLDEVVGVPGAAGHAGHSATPAATTESKETMLAPIVPEGNETMARAEPQSSPPTEKPVAGSGTAITATGIVQSIDKANGKVKLTHDPITALGWPKMTMFFRVKDAALADQIKEGDAVQFSLEKSPSGYVISGFKKAMPDNDMQDMTKGEKQ